MSQHVKPGKASQDRDFTGGMIPPTSSSYVGSTGESGLDGRIRELVQGTPEVPNHCLLEEMMITAVRIARGGAVTEGDFKLMNRALKEMREANEVFHPYRNHRKVTVFGSARTQPEEPAYEAAVEFSRRMWEEGFMTITGAGPGIMAAGNKGAGRENSFGLDIALPFEASANEFISGDPKLISFNYFFTRKLSFVKEADAAVGLPGGFGTMDEIFEALTLIQTGKASIYPIVLLDAKGGTYWKFWKQFVDEHLARLGMISDNDFHLFRVTDDVEEAVEEILRFYRVFHSYRYVGDKIVLRLNAALTDEALAAVEEEFSDILKAGRMIQREALEEEADEEELSGLVRLVFRHRRRDFGRLRQLIDAVNDGEVIAEK
ncbi:MAG: TIGR00730 family Rossman fold protein [Verrucomicrobiota bacterium]|nr:TIGR00730 family Rossman fold protein [Verrucomicrobiota bacterium]